MLSGTLPSCTPVRDYDQVEVVLQPMAYEVEDCKELPREATGRLAKLAPLTAVNDTHGMFHVAIGNITHETYYCLRVELGTFHMEFAQHSFFPNPMHLNKYCLALG
jgi:hypothetical protein